MSDTETEVVEEVVELGGQEVDTTEDVARKSGWVDKDEWKDKGNDPAEHRSAELYNERGLWIEKDKQRQRELQQLRTDTDKRIDNLNTLHNRQVEADRARLTQSRDALVQDGDVAGVTNIQSQIDNLQHIPQQEAPAVDPAYAQFQSDNAWVSDGGPKSVYAHNQVSHYQKMGYGADTVLSMMQADLDREFPAVNTQIQGAPMAETSGSKPGNKPKSGKLSMSDCTPEEIKMRQAIDWDSDASFLQAVKDSRG